MGGTSQFFFSNNQDHGTFIPPTPLYQDWSNTYSNAFHQSWEGQTDFSWSFQGDDFNNLFLPPTLFLQQVEHFKSLETMMNDHMQNMQNTQSDIATSQLMLERSLMSLEYNLKFPYQVISRNLNLLVRLSVMCLFQKRDRRSRDRRSSGEIWASKQLLFTWQ